MTRIKNWLYAISNIKFLILVLLLAIFVSVLFIEFYENKLIWGDEPSYISITHIKAENQISPVISLLPGFMSYDFWPPFTFSIYSFFLNDKIRDHFTHKKYLYDEDLEIESMQFVNAVAYFQLFLLLVSGVLIYLISNTLNLGPVYSALAVALTILNPRVLFYVQALWPELIHYVFLLSGIFFFISYLKKNSLVYLLISSIFFVYCLFTKLIVSYYFYLLIVILVLYHRKTINQKKTIYALCLFIIPFFLLSSIQRGVNYYKYNTFAIATNSWINIELGILPEEIAAVEGFDSLADRYWITSSDPVERELKAKERVIEYVAKSLRVNEFITKQFSKYYYNLSSSYLEKGIIEYRWSRSDFFDIVNSITKFFTIFLFVFGSTGAILYSRKNIVIFSVALFVLYYLAILFILFFNARFIVQLIPFLAIFTSMVLKDLIAASRKDL